MFALQDRARVDEMLYYDATVTNKTWQELMVSEKVYSRRETNAVCKDKWQLFKAFLLAYANRYLREKEAPPTCLWHL